MKSFAEMYRLNAIEKSLVGKSFSECMRRISNDFSYVTQGESCFDHLILPLYTVFAHKFQFRAYVFLAYINTYTNAGIHTYTNCVHDS